MSDSKIKNEFVAKMLKNKILDEDAAKRVNDFIEAYDLVLETRKVKAVGYKGDECWVPANRWNLSKCCTCSRYCIDWYGDGCRRCKRRQCYNCVIDYEEHSCNTPESEIESETSDEEEEEEDNKKKDEK